MSVKFEYYRGRYCYNERLSDADDLCQLSILFGRFYEKLCFRPVAGEFIKISIV